MGYHDPFYPRPLVPNTQDPTAVDFRAFYPYTPNEVKHRKRTTTQQLKVLEAIFKKDTKPNAQLRQELAAELKMTARGVQVWFQNRRAKEKAKVGRVSLSNPAEEFLGESSSSMEEDSTRVKSESFSIDSLLEDTPVDESRDLLDTSLSSPSDSATSLPQLPAPPQLHVVTDTSALSWNTSSPIEPPPDSAASYTSPGLPEASSCIALPTNVNMTLGSANMYSHRRGSLPVTANMFCHAPTSVDVDSLDPLVRRRSVDASLHRLACNPYATFARAKNSALYGPGVGVADADNPTNCGTNSEDVPYHLAPHYGPQRLQRRFVSSSALSAAAQFGSSFPHTAGSRRFSMDSRVSRVGSMQRMRHSPSPSPLSTYGSGVRASLPDTHLYSLSARPVASPIPGPLPMPGFQFGAATTTPPMESPSSADSERNSPDSLRSFSYGEEDEGQTSPSYETYSSRFSSVASISTSDSSINSAFYAAPSIEHSGRPDPSCVSVRIFGMSPEQETTNSVEYIQNSSAVGIDDCMRMGTGLVPYSTGEEYGGYAADEEITLVASDMHRLQQEQQESLSAQHSQVYTSSVPSNSVNGGDVPTPLSQDTSSIPIAASSELAFALESKHSELSINSAQPSAQEYVNFGVVEHPVAQGPTEPFQHPQMTYYSAEVQQYHQEPAYPSTYPFTNTLHATPSPGEFGVYNSEGFSDPLMTSQVLDSGLQGVETFAVYS